MKIEISRLEMLEAAKNAARIAPSSSPVEALNGILVEGSEDTDDVYLTATNFDVGLQHKIRASVGQSGAMLINPQLLVGMLSLLSGDTVTLSADKPELLTVTGGRCVYTINCLPAAHYPKPVMPFPEETVLLTGVCSLARRTTFVVAKDDSKPALQCVSVKLRNNAVHAAACDGTSMMLIKDASDTSEEREFLLPGRSLQMLAAISKDDDVFEVGDVGHEVVFTRGDMLFSIRKLPVNGYMDTTAVVKAVVPAYSAVTDACVMKTALEFITAGAAGDTGKEPINMALSNGQVVLWRNGDYSEARTAVPAAVTKATPRDGFCYDTDGLFKLFHVIDGRVKLDMDAKGVLLVKTRSEVYFRMPRRAAAKRAGKAAKGGKPATPEAA